jgi:putative oxidoreductase
MSYPASLGLLLIRGMVGYVMFYHGAGKLFGWFDGPGMEGFIAHVPDLGVPNIPPKYLAYAAAGSEFGGGILLMIGFLTRLAAIPVAFTMGVAAFKVHGHAFSLAAKPVPGMEFALTLMVIAIGLIFTGPGWFAIDALFRRRKPANDSVEKVEKVEKRKK